MKSIPNKETSIINGDNGQPCKYSNLIQLLLNIPKQSYTWPDIENRPAIKKALDHEAETIELEDAHFKYLKALIETSTWPICHEDLLTFKNDMSEIK